MNLQEFSARKSGPGTYRNRFRTILRTAWTDGNDQKQLPKQMEYGLFWVAVGAFGLGIVPYVSKLVCKPIGPHLGRIWDTYKPVVAHVWITGLLLGYCWLALLLQT